MFRRYNEEDGEGLILDNKYLMEESRWLHQAMSRVERYVILHKPMVYCIKEN